MQSAVSRLHETRDLLLVAAMVAVITGTSAIAAGLNTPDGIELPAVAAQSLADATVPNPSSPQAVIFPCDCEGPNHPAPAPRPDVVRSDTRSAAPRAQAPEPSRSVEAGSFAQWTRAEADPRYILTRMATLSRHAPRSYASEPRYYAAEPEWGGVDRENT